MNGGVLRKREDRRFSILRRNFLFFNCNFVVDLFKVKNGIFEIIFNDQQGSLDVKNSCVVWKF